MKPLACTPNERAALAVVLDAIRAARKLRSGQTTILIEHHGIGDGIDLFVSPQNTGTSFRVEDGKAERR
jgi:hypothetical protein